MRERERNVKERVQCVENKCSYIITSTVIGRVWREWIAVLNLKASEKRSPFCLVV